jgi:hypothetical protein
MSVGAISTSASRRAAQVAVLVLAHDPVPLQYLLDTLDARFRIFIHIDAKTALDRIARAGLRLPAHATLVNPRIAVFWGGFSMLRATLALIDAALAEAPFERLVLLSGDTLPVRRNDVLHDTLLDDRREFIELVEVPDDPGLAGTSAETCAARLGWVQPWRFHNRTDWDHILLNPATRAEAAAQYGLDQSRADWLRGDAQALVQAALDLLPPRPKLFARLRYGSQWWALSGATLRAIRSRLHDPAVHAWFRHLQVPDEHMIHTVLANELDIDACGTPVWSDLARRAAGQHTLDGEGFRRAARQGSQVLFARKFHPDADPTLAAELRAGACAGDIGN